MFDSVGKPEKMLLIFEVISFSLLAFAFLMSQSHGNGCSGNPGVLLKLAQFHIWLEFFKTFSSLVRLKFLEALH